MDQLSLSATCAKAVKLSNVLNTLRDIGTAHGTEP